MFFVLLLAFVGGGLLLLLQAPENRGDSELLPIAAPVDERADDNTVQPFINSREIVEESSVIPPQKTVRVTAGATRGPVGRLRGQVLSEASRPLPGATLFLFEITPQAFVRNKRFLSLTATTDASGAYLLSDVPAGRPLLLRCVAEGMAFSEVECPPVEADREVTVADIVLHVGFMLRGMVQDSRGLPLAGATVRAVNRIDAIAGLPEGYSVLESTTDGSGRYVITQLSPENYEITAKADGFIPVSKSLLFGFLGNTEREMSLDFQLETGCFAIHGQVLTSSGEPLGQVLVEVNSLALIGHTQFCKEVFTDSRGRFTIEGLSDGRFMLNVTCAGFFLPSPRSIQPEEETEPIELRLDRKGAIRGRLAAPSSRDIGSYSIGVDRFVPQARGSLMGNNPPVKGRGKAAFKVHNLLPGTYTLLVKAGGYAWTRSAEVVVAAGETTTDVVIYLEEGGSLTGRIESVQGGLAPGFEVRLMHRNYQPSLHFGLRSDAPAEQDKKTQSGADGSFVMNHILPGQYSLEISGTGLATKLIRDVTIIQGEVLDLGSIKITTGGNLIGQAFDKQGALAKGARVVAMNKDTGHCLRAVTDNNGFFRIQSLAAGTYLVYLENTSWDGFGLRSELTVHVREGSTEKVEIHVRDAP